MASSQQSDQQQKRQEQAAAAVAVLVAQQAAAYSRLEDKVVEQVKKLMGQLFNRWYFQPEVNKVVDQIVDVVREGQEQAAILTEQYMDAINDAMGVRVKPRARDTHVKLPKRLRDVDPKTEWNRPARDARVGRLLGADEFQANEKALVRAEQQARMDLLKAMQEAEKQRWGVSDDIIGYRRIIHPEAGNQGPVCGLCIAASSRIYSTETLKALHGGCRCTVLPVLKDGAGNITDPGRSLNEADLKRIYAAAGGTEAEKLQAIEVTVFDHGELGPILVDTRHTPRKVAKPKATDDDGKPIERPKMSPENLYDIQKKIVDDFDAAVKNGRTPQFDIEYHRRQVERLAKQLGKAA